MIDEISLVWRDDISLANLLLESLIVLLNKCCKLNQINYINLVRRFKQFVT